MSDELPHAEIVTAWAQGREIPEDVRAVKDWLDGRAPEGVLSAADLEALAGRATAERWHPEAIEAAMLLWQLSTAVDATDKPAA